MTTQQAPQPSGASVHIAGEIRAELARQHMSMRQFALKIGASQLWVSRRISMMQTDMTPEDISLMADALGVPVWRLLPRTWLPRLDSNQQPAGSARRSKSEAPITRLPSVRGADERPRRNEEQLTRPALRLVK